MICIYYNKYTDKINQLSVPYLPQTHRSVSVPTPRWTVPSSSTVSPVIVITNARTVEFTRSKEFQDKFATIPVYLRAQEFITADGKQLTSHFYKVMAAGGINCWLGIDNPVVLSLIMDDRRCHQLTPELVTTLLQGLRISRSTTFDIDTYLNWPQMAEDNLRELQEKNSTLLRMNPSVHFLGLVKGSTLKQNITHVLELQDLGITEFIFHAGAYLCQGTRYEFRWAQMFATEIRKQVDHLIIYGLGAKRWIEAFSFVDGLVTLNHIIETRNGVFTTETGNIIRQHHRKKHPNQLTLHHFWDGIPANDDLDAILYRNSPWYSFCRIQRDFAKRGRSTMYLRSFGMDERQNDMSVLLLNCCSTCPCLLRGCC